MTYKVWKTLTPEQQKAYFEAYKKWLASHKS